jgi:stage II sporulation protein D
MRRFLCLITLALAVPASASGGAAFFVDGHGWGHGIGMAQWGAYGYALKDGRSCDWILGHYYTDTTIGQSSVPTVRVLLLEGRKSVVVGSGAPFSLTDSKDKTVAFPAGSMTLGKGLRVNGRQLTGPVTFTRGAQVLKLGGRPYRGKLVAHVRNSRLTIVNRVGIDDYISGVVPDEMPPTWSMEALKAQAVAARSYAVATRKTGGIFDLYPDTRSQVYGGVNSEETRSNKAVDQTAGEVVKYNGNVATTFFHSTSGGRTASIEDVWNSPGRPYLVSVPDKYDSLSPHHNWGPFRYTAGSLKRQLGSSAPSGTLLDATVARNPSLRVDTVTLRGAGGTRGISGPGFQSALGLRSSWFSIAVLSLTGGGNVQAGKARVLHGLARGVKNVWLERRTAGNGWMRVRDLTPGADGRFPVKVRPRVTTWFRLGAPKGDGVPVQVTVSK